MIKSKYRGGFTLIEMLVVIAIIGVLSAILYVSFGEAREQARNKAIRSELKEVQLAIELYRSQNGEYPAAQDMGRDGCSESDVDTNTTYSFIKKGKNTDLSFDGCTSLRPFIDDLIPDYVGELPSYKDSSNSECNYYYYVEADDHSAYKLIADRCLAGVTEAQPDDKFARCPNSCLSGTNKCGSADYEETDVEFYESLAVYSLGGECY